MAYFERRLLDEVGSRSGFLLLLLRGRFGGRGVVCQYLLSGLRDEIEDWGRRSLRLMHVTKFIYEYLI